LIAGAASYRFLEIAKLNLERRGTLEQKEICKYLWSGTFKNDDHVSEFIKIMKSMYSKNSDFINSTKMSKDGPSFSYKVLNLGFGDFLRHFDYEADLGKISCKTLIIVGKDDWINDPSQLKIVASKIPDAKLEILDNCGHFVAIDQHQRYINLIKNVISTS
jgi:proline iminopeptidase